MPRPLVRWANMQSGPLSEKNAATVSMAAVASTTLLLLGRVVMTTPSLETKLTAAWLLSFGLLYPLQGIVAPMRRRWGHYRIVWISAMAAYYAPTFIAFYAANAVYSIFDINDKQPLLKARALTMVCLAVFLSSGLGAGRMNMTAYSLRDGPRDRWLRFLQSVLYLGCLELGWVLSGEHQGLKLALHILSCIVAHVVLVVLCRSPDSVMDCQTKAVADYMKQLSRSAGGSGFFDNGAAGDIGRPELACCRYPLLQKREDDGSWTWITIKDLPERGNNLAGVANGDQDIWLSYSLSRLLARRYYGFRCAEEGDPAVLDFALDQLRQGWKKAFTIVEVQLAFLHDYFFTASLPKIQSDSATLPGEPGILCRMIFALVQSDCILLAVCIFLYTGWLGSDDGHFVALATVLVSQLLFVQLLPVQDLLPIYWRPIQFAFRRVNRREETGWEVISRRCLGIRSDPSPADALLGHQRSDPSLDSR